MFKRRFRLPSPALVISMVTLSLVLGGTAVAASTSKHSDKKADTKLVKKLAPSLSVKHAKTANSATNATNAADAAALGGHPAGYYAHAGHEAVHLVGAAGEPAFQNGWANFSAGVWSSAGFWKDGTGVVHLQGTLAPGTVGQPAFTLPAGYRPATNIYVPTASGGSALGAYILATGEIEPQAAGDIGLDGLSFLAGPLTATAKHHASTRAPNG